MAPGIRRSEDLVWDRLVRARHAGALGFSAQGGASPIFSGKPNFLQAAQNSERQQAGRSGGSRTPRECNGGGSEGEDATPTGTARRAEWTAAVAPAQCTWAKSGAPTETSLLQCELVDGPGQTSGARVQGKRKGGSGEDISEEEYGRGVKKKRQAYTLPSPP